MDECERIEELIDEAKRLSSMGAAWHFHLAKTPCEFFPMPFDATLVFEADGTTRLMEVNDVDKQSVETLARLLHGDAVVSGDVTTIVDSEIVHSVRDLVQRGIPWHHHGLAPNCAFNASDRWRLVLESAEGIQQEEFDAEPLAELAVIEPLFHAQ